MKCKTYQLVTKGKFSCKPRIRLSNGLLCCPDDIIPVEPIKPLRKGSSKINSISDNTLWEKIKQEDEEIMTIIKIFLKCQ